MNVEDFEIAIPEGDMLETIFTRQRELMNKYHPIEEGIVGRTLPSAKGILGAHDGALNIDDRQSQLRFKDFAWRITEELTEATLALDEDNHTHFLEELIDALHFSVELLIMCGMFPLSSVGKSMASGDQLEVAFSISKFTDHVNIHTLTYLVIESLGEAMNRLKLKPWKSTPILTDEKAFRQSLSEFFAALIDLLKASGFTAKTATQMYLNKNAVNQFRIGSNY
jgi:dimeric dUTPase (all-alpha-NTP-PPase superfamily)